MGMLAFIRSRVHPLWRLRRLKWYRRAQATLDFPVSKRIGKISVYFFLLRDFSYLVVDDDLERQVGRCFDAIVTKFQPNCFLDVGANVGRYSWRLLNLTDQTDVWLFEPDTQNIQLLQRTISRNKLARVRLHPVAVSDQAGTAEFIVDEVSGSTGSLKDHAYNTWSLHHAYGASVKRLVPCLELDSFYEELRTKRVLIKIDVEGAEEMVLRGARRLLAEVRPIILIECYELEKKGWLADFNYMIHDFKEGDNYVAFPAELKSQAGMEWLSTLLTEMSDHTSGTLPGGGG